MGKMELIRYVFSPASIVVSFDVYDKRLTKKKKKEKIQSGDNAFLRFFLIFAFIYQMERSSRYNGALDARYFDKRETREGGGGTRRNVDS